MSTQEQTPDIFSTHHLQKDLRSRSLRGGFLTLTSQGVQFLMQSVLTIVLAHLLLPADFGLVAMVTAITGLGQAFADLGLSEATIQHPTITHQQVSTLFWINLGIGLLLAAATVGLAPVLAAFYHEPRLRAVAVVMSMTFIIGGLRVQHSALLQRNMRYLAMALRDITAYLVAVPVAILLALRGAGYWAIVAFPLICNGTAVILTWAIVRWIPGLPDMHTKIRHLIKFGGNVAASYLAMTITRSADNILIGRYWGAAPLGLYSRAINLLYLPVRQLSTPARSVAVPTFSRLQDDQERLARFYLRLTNVMVWISSPVFGFLFVAATPVMIVVLGYKWRAAGPVFQILAIFSLGQLLYESLTWLLISRGQSERLFRMVLVVSPLAIASYAIGLPFGIRGVALAGTLEMLILFPWVLRYCFRGTTLTLLRLGQQLLWPVFTTLCGVTFGELAMHIAPPLSAIAQILVVAAAYFIGCCFALLLAPVRKELQSLKRLIPSQREAP